MAFLCDTFFLIYTSAALCCSAVFAVIACLSVRPSVCPSVTSRSCTNYVEWLLRITKTTPHDYSQGTLVLWRWRSLRHFDRITLTGAPIAGGICKKWKFQFFDRSRSLRLRSLTGFTAKNVFSRHDTSFTTVRIHDGALAEECAVSSTTLVVVEVCRLSWKFVYHTFGSSLQRYIMRRGASHARCAIVEPIATMLIPNYADSRIQSASQADTRSVCVIRTTLAQYFNWYRASCGSLDDSGDSLMFDYTCGILLMGLRFKIIIINNNNSNNNLTRHCLALRSGLPYRNFADIFGVKKLYRVPGL